MKVVTTIIYERPNDFTLSSGYYFSYIGLSNYNHKAGQNWLALMFQQGNFMGVR